MCVAADSINNTFNTQMTTTTTTMFSTLSLCLFLTVAVANLGFSYATNGQWANQTTHRTRCVPMEREALLEFKKHLVDRSNRLATWTASAADDVDCCSWKGVSCRHLGDSTTQYVTGLHLRSLPQVEFYSGYFSSIMDPYMKTLFGGNISFALSSLKHLRYLDLSYNDFGGISIPSFLGSMKSLSYLNLSGAGFGGMIPHQLGNLSNLQYLNLDSRYFDTYAVADVENLQWLSGLSSLKFLDLSGRNLSKVLDWDKMILTTLPSLLQLHLSQCQLPSPQPHLPYNKTNASSISILDLSFNSIGRQSATFLSWVSNLKTLNSLNIEGNELRGSIPSELKNMSTLQEVYLGLNSLSSSIPNWLYGQSKLKVLSLSSNQLSSFQPHSSVKNFSSLSILDLSDNNFQGPFLDEIQNMSSLQKLDLSYNEFGSHIPDWLNGLIHLEYLDLSGNKKLRFEGGIPKSFKNLKVLGLEQVKLRQDINQVLEILSLPSNGLETLLLDDCQLFGNLSTINQYFDRLMSLKHLNLGFNNFSGTFPLMLGRLKKLEELVIDGNKLVGDVSEVHFENLNNLRSFYASGNQLKLRVSFNWIPHFDQLLFLKLGSWHIGPHFPTWLRSLNNLKSLDLSNSGISSTIPIWFWNFSSNMADLNLSHNQIHGMLPNILPSFTTVDMSSNRFHGLLPLIHSHLFALDLSNNSFSDSISKFLCPPNFNSSMQANSLEYLNLGQNHLYGEITNCLALWSRLVVINLSDNKLNGTIPESIGTLDQLESLHLRNNSLSGELPQSLNECTELITVDVGENEFLGNISSFSGVQLLFGMKILILRSNKFSGPIPEKLCEATSLQVLDLANNLFNGIIPSCLGNLSAMAKINKPTELIEVSTNFYGGTIETALLGIKGYMLEYSRNLGLVRSLDLSNNRLCGKIPDEITGLYALVSLNVSHNALSGGIPKNIGFMKNLFSMDFSVNQLSGEIPQSISRLTFLVNLSQNRLSGRIPFENQMQTLDASSFAGNELCGNPLPNNCSNDIVPNDANDKGREDDEDGMIWFYVSMAFGFVGGFWCFVGPLLLNRRWGFAYSQFLDRVWNRIWWKLHRFGML